MTKKRPPHLPAHNFSLDGFRRLVQLKWFFIMVVTGVISGAIAGAVTLAWLFPADQSTSSYIVNRLVQTKAVDTPSLDAELLRRTRERVVNVVDTTYAVGGDFVEQSAYISSAALLSSDGWSVMLLPESGITQTRLRSWQGVDYQGKALTIQKTLVDTDNNLLFVKFDMHDARVMSFGQWEDVKDGLGMWTLSPAWDYTRIEKSHALSSRRSALQASANPLSFTLTDHAAHDALAITSAGDLVGFARGNQFIPAWFAQHHLSSILEQGSLKQTHRPWYGYFVTKMTDVYLQDNAPAFYVSRSRDSWGTGVRVGDIITHINGQQIHPTSFHRIILEHPDGFELGLLRAGEEITLSITPLTN